MTFETCPNCGNETLSDDFSTIPVNGRAVHSRCFPKYSELAAERGVRTAVSEIIKKSVSWGGPGKVATAMKAYACLVLGRVSDTLPAMPFERIRFWDGKFLYVWTGITNWTVACDAEYH